MLTLKQYQSQKYKDYRNTKEWRKSLKLDEEDRAVTFQSKMEEWKQEWYNIVVEYGQHNRVPSKVVYEFDKAFGREQLLNCFRGDRIGLYSRVNSDGVHL